MSKRAMAAVKPRLVKLDGLWHCFGLLTRKPATGATPEEAYAVWHRRRSRHVDRGAYMRGYAQDRRDADKAARLELA